MSAAILLKYLKHDAKALSGIGENLAPRVQAAFKDYSGGRDLASISERLTTVRGIGDTTAEKIYQSRMELVDFPTPAAAPPSAATPSLQPSRPIRTPTPEERAGPFSPQAQVSTPQSTPAAPHIVPPEQFPASPAPTFTPSPASAATRPQQNALVTQPSAPVQTPTASAPPQIVPPAPPASLTPPAGTSTAVQTPPPAQTAPQAVYSQGSVISSSPPPNLTGPASPPRPPPPPPSLTPPAPPTPRPPAAPPAQTTAATTQQSATTQASTSKTYQPSPFQQPTTTPLQDSFDNPISRDQLIERSLFLKKALRENKTESSNLGLMGFLSGETGALKAERRMLRGESESIEHLLDTYSAKTAFDADALVSPSGAVKRSSVNYDDPSTFMLQPYTTRGIDQVMNAGSELFVKETRSTGIGQASTSFFGAIGVGGAFGAATSAIIGNDPQSGFVAGGLTALGARRIGANIMSPGGLSRLDPGSGSIFSMSKEAHESILKTRQPMNMGIQTRHLTLSGGMLGGMAFSNRKRRSRGFNRSRGNRF